MSTMKNGFVRDILAILKSVTTDALFVLDREGAILWANDRAVDLVGNGKGSIVHQTIFKYLPVREEFECVLQKQVSSGLQQEINETLYRITITPVPSDGDGEAVFVLTCRDITDLKTLQRIVAEKVKANRELEEIIDACSDGIYVTDGEGVTLRVNPACERITGLVKSQILGKDMKQIVQEGQLSASCSLKVLETKQRTTILQIVPNGRQVMVTGTPIYDESGKLYRIVSNTRDITELSELKAKVQMERNLTHQYYMELVGLKLKQITDTNIIAYSPEMAKTLELAMMVARTESTIMISGESGAGKEVIARLIHNESMRKDHAFMKINCAAIPENLLESELFGYESGAFTGAKKGGKAGLLELANRGTLFLDEIGDLPYALQSKLLQVLQEQVFFRVGGTQPTRVDVRIITASNKDLRQMLKEKTFREDLYYRLNVIPIHIAPLRERRDDIPPLLSYFLNKFNGKHSLNKQISHETVNILVNYQWPGNVRELENLMERLILLTPGDIIQPEHLPGQIYKSDPQESVNVRVNELIPFKEALESMEKQLFSMAYKEHGNTYKAAEALGVSQPTVVRKLNKYKRSEESYR